MMLSIDIPQPEYSLKIEIDDVGRHIISLDGCEINRKLVFGAKNICSFERVIAGRSRGFQVDLRSKGLMGCRCKVTEDGKEIYSADHKLAIPRTRVFAFKEWFADTPRWSWIFIGLCILIPVVTLGGAVPAIIGFLGAWSCQTLARQTKWHAFLRLALCALVTLVSWSGLFAALVAIQQITQKH